MPLSLLRYVFRRNDNSRGNTVRGRVRRFDTPSKPIRAKSRRVARLCKDQDDNVYRNRGQSDGSETETQ